MNRKLTEEHKRKIAQSVKKDWKLNREKYQERCRRISEALKGKPAWLKRKEIEIDEKMEARADLMRKYGE